MAWGGGSKPAGNQAAIRAAKALATPLYVGTVNATFNI